MTALRNKTRARRRSRRPAVLAAAALLLLSSVAVLAVSSAAEGGGADRLTREDNERDQERRPRRRASETDGGRRKTTEEDEAEDADAVGPRSSSSGGAASPSSGSSAAALPSDPSLGPDSVVLITGAAGFVGSELALALRRVYRVRKLLLVDSLGIESEAGSAYVPPPSGGHPGTKKVYERYDEEGLSTFEIKRQRLFRVFQELTAADFYDEEDEDEEEESGEGLRGLDSMRLYRADMRPSIPEFFNIGEVPLLEGIFQSNPDITHVVHLAGEFSFRRLRPAFSALFRSISHFIASTRLLWPNASHYAIALISLQI